MLFALSSCNVGAADEGGDEAACVLAVLVLVLVLVLVFVLVLVLVLAGMCVPASGLLSCASMCASSFSSSSQNFTSCTVSPDAPMFSMLCV